ncbi:MAG TPA: hypothetical protein VD995_26205 [Azospirillum sp.]|nr:hypothetical protein [Azospirillum sp.]
MNRERAAHTCSFPLFRRSVAAMVAAVAVAGVSLPAAAAGKPACYSRAEHAAEQTLRMHTELMVTGLTCQSVVPEKAPYAKYQEFTVKNRSLISKAEAAMIDHYRRTSGGNATRSFDMFRTELANEVSRRAATIGTTTYCATFVERAKNALDLTPDDIRVLTTDEQSAGLKHLASKPLCDVKVVSLPDSMTVASVEPSRSKAKPGTAKATTAKASNGKPAPAKATTVKAPAPAKAKPAKPNVAEVSKPNKG